MALGFLGKIFGGGVKEVAGAVTDVVGAFIQDPSEKAAAALEIERILMTREVQLQESIRKELEAKERIIVAELNQGDNYTRRARPSVVYSGLLFILFNYVIAPLFLADQKSLELPVEFWMAWGGIVATWSVGRSFEKNGTHNKATSVVTGSKTSLFE